MSSIINPSDHLYGDQPDAGRIIVDDFPDTEPFIKKSGYRYISTAIRRAVARGEVFYLGVELYTPQMDEIWASPNSAVFAFSDSRFRWHNRLYKDKIKSIPELKKFIGRTFNSFTIEMENVERGVESGSDFVFTNLIRGFRVAVRIIFPNLQNDAKYSRLIWWGRVSTVDDVNEETVKINCSQEVGDFSYELATQKYGQACWLWFGKGECLGNETFEQKSLPYRTAFEAFGQGGCNRTKERCVALGNEEFFQGQTVVTINGQFYREEKVKKGWWIFSWIKTNRIPVQFSSKNQSDNDKKTIPLAFGRVRIELNPITWADIGTSITALLGACKGQIEGFYNITCHNANLAIQSVTQHLGELGGVGTQQPDPRFPTSGYNSKLAYIGATFTGSDPEDEGEDVPVTSAVVKAMLVDVRNRFGTFLKEWSVNPVWITRFILMNFPYTVVKPEWFNENKNHETANYCFQVIEDDTQAEIAVITGSSHQDYLDGKFQRFSSTGKFTGANIGNGQIVQLANQPDVPDPNADLGGISPDVWFGNGLGVAPVGVVRSYLTHRYTCNGVVNDKVKLADLLFSLVLPTFKGYLKFNHFGQIEIDCRKPADNTFIRVDMPIGSTEIGVGSVVKFYEGYGYLLIGTGRNEAEIARPKGIRYVNGSANTMVNLSISGSLGGTVSPTFIEREGGPSEIYLDFSGTPALGEQITLTFTEPSGEVYKWDYFVDTPDDLDLVVQMFKTRLMASPVFRETWTADVFSGFPHRIIVRCQTGYIKLDRPLVNAHYIGEEVLRVVEVYEDGKDGHHSNGIKDNMKDFVLNNKRTETYHGVKSTYISAIQDFRETEIQPRVAWDAAEQERNLKLLELDLRFVDNYRQAAFLTKSATIQFVDGNLPASFKTGILGLFHEEGEVIAIRHQIMGKVSYTPFTIEALSYSHASQETSLDTRLYLSAAYDERVAKEEKFLESTLTTNPQPTATPPPVLSRGGYSSTRTGDGNSDTQQRLKYEPQPYETLPEQQKYSPHGRDKL